MDVQCEIRNQEHKYSLFQNLIYCVIASIVCGAALYELHLTKYEVQIWLRFLD